MKYKIEFCIIYYFSERRPLKGFMKMYKTPPQRRRKKDETNDDGDLEGEVSDEGDGDDTQNNHLNSAKDAVIPHNQTNNVSVIYDVFHSLIIINFPPLLKIVRNNF